MRTPELFEIILKDFFHAVSGTKYCNMSNISWKTRLYTTLTCEFQVVFLFRIYNFLYRNEWMLVSHIIYIITKFLYKCDIHPKAEIGKGFLLVHPFDIVIGANVEMGTDVVIFNGVSFGKKYPGRLMSGMPKVGNSCLFGTGAKILGDIHIGNNVTIGANAVVISDVADNETCVGNPARPTPSKDSP